MSFQKQLEALVGFHRGFVREALRRGGEVGFPLTLSDDASAPSTDSRNAAGPDLTTTLLVLPASLSHLIPPERHRILEWVLGQQRADGSFDGRTEGSRVLTTAAAITSLTDVLMRREADSATERAYESAGRWLVALTRRHAPTRSVPDFELATVASAIGVLSNHAGLPEAPAACATLTAELLARLGRTPAVRPRLWMLRALLDVFHQCAERDLLRAVEDHVDVLGRRLDAAGIVPAHLEEPRRGDAVTQALFTRLACMLDTSDFAAPGIRQVLTELRADGSHKPTPVSGLDASVDFARVSGVYAASLIHEAIQAFAQSCSGRTQIPLWTRPASSLPPVAGRRVVFMTHEPVEHACPRLRIDGPLRRVAAGGAVHYAVGTEIARRYVLLTRDLASSADVVLFQRFFPAWLVGKAAMPVLERSAAALVYDLDDWLFELPSGIDQLNDVEGASPALRRAIRTVDLVTTTTEPLANRLRDLGARDVLVIPNAIDLDDFPLPAGEPERNGRRPVRMVYAGTPSHEPDLRMIAPVLRDLLQRYPGQMELHLWGCVPAELETLPGVVVEREYHWNYRAYVTRLCEARFDVALSPLEATGYNACKSPIKWLEYSAAGAAGVYSKLDPYAHVVRPGEDGLLVGPALSEWSAAIERLLLDPGLRASIAARARDRVRESFAVERVAPTWLDAIETALRNRARRSSMHAGNPIDIRIEEELRAA